MFIYLSAPILALAGLEVLTVCCTKARDDDKQQ